MWRLPWRISKNMNETRRGYDLPLTAQWWQLWSVLIAVAPLVFYMEWGFREDDSMFPWIMRCFYPLLLLIFGQEFVRHFGKLHFVPEGIAITLFGKTLRQYPRERIRFLGGISCAKKSRTNKWICVCSRSLEEMAAEQNRRTAKMFRDAPTLPGWTENMARKFLWSYAESLNRALGFPRKDILLIEWSPERLELLLQMYPGVPWCDLSDEKKLDAER